MAGALAVAGLVEVAGSVQPEPLPIIDVHLHAQPLRGAGVKPAWLPDGLVSPASDDEMLAKTLAVLDRLNVVKAVVSGPFERVSHWKSAARDRFIGSIVFPHAQALDQAALRREFGTGTLAAFGEVVAQLQGLSPSDELFEPYYAMCEELDIPVGVHTGFPPPGAAYGSVPKTRATLGSPLLLEEAILRHRKMRVYVMHAGYPYLEDTIALLHGHPQVYVDIAGIDWMLPRPEFHEYLRRLVQAGFGKRVMFGSDQMQWPEAVAMAVEGVEQATFLSSEQKRDIFYNNAARFFRLNPAR